MDYSLLMEIVSTIASRLATSGAETYRIEESVRRITASYGIDSRVYAIPHTLIITIMIPEDRPLTQLCRMDQIRTDLESVELYSNLSREICTQKPDWETALSRVQEVEHSGRKYPLPMVLLGYALVGGGFCLFYGGGVLDAICAGISCLLPALLSRWLSRTNTFFEKIISAFLVAFVSYGFGALGWATHTDSCVIAALMLLVPGMLFTNALRDIIFGDTNSGINRIVEVLLIAAALALGTAAAWHSASSLWGMPDTAPLIPYGTILQCLFSVLACMGFVIVFNIHGFGSLLCAMGGGLTWGVYSLAKSLEGPELLCIFLSTVAASFFAEIVARIRKYPAISYLIVSLLPLLPGSNIYYAARQAVEGNLDAFLYQSSHALTIAGVMAVGILLVVTWMGLWNNLWHKALPNK